MEMRSLLGQSWYFPPFFVISQVEDRGEQKQSKGLGDVFSQEQVWDCDFGETVGSVLLLNLFHL